MAFVVSFEAIQLLDPPGGFAIDFECASTKEQVVKTSQLQHGLSLPMTGQSAMAAGVASAAWE